MASRPPPTTPIEEQGYPAERPAADGHRPRPRRRARACRSPRPTPPTAARRSPGRGSADLARRLRRLRLEPGGQRAARDLRRVHGRRPTSSRPGRSGCRRARRASAARPSPATPATPTCRAPRWRRRWSRPPRALVRHLNPDLAGAGDRAPDQGDRAPPAGRRLDRRPRLGDPRRGRRADPRREHRPPRARRRASSAAGAHGASRTHHRCAGGGRPAAAGRARVGHRALRAVARDRRRALQAPVLDHAHDRAGSRCAAAARYRFYTSRSTTRATASRRPSRPTRASAASAR